MSEPRYAMETFVEALYRGILSRAPDEKGFLGHIQRLTSLGTNATDLAPFVRGFLSSQEYHDKATRQFAQKLIATSLSLNGEPVDVVSLGSHCLVAYALKEMGLKRYSCPFDWIFSRPSMVEHCIKDTFVTLSDRSQYQSVIDESGTEMAGRCHHAYYRHSFGVDRVFNHRDVRLDKNYEYLLRCIDRFMALLESTNRKVFVLLSPEPRLNSEAFVSLHNRLSMLTSNFCLVAVMLRQPEMYIRDFGIDFVERVGSSTLLVMRSISKAGPLTFEDPFDDFMFRRAIVGFSGSQEL